MYQWTNEILIFQWPPYSISQNHAGWKIACSVRTETLTSVWCAIRDSLSLLTEHVKVSYFFFLYDIFLLLANYIQPKTRHTAFVKHLSFCSVQFITIIALIKLRVSYHHVEMQQNLGPGLLRDFHVKNPCPLRKIFTPGREHSSQLVRSHMRKIINGHAF